MRTIRAIALGASLASGVVGVGCAESGPGPSLGPDTLIGPETITINGKVVDGDLQPLAGLPVLVTGHAQVTTDGDGQFSVSGVEKPYDVATALSELRFGVLYTGLTRDDPVLMISVTNLPTPQTHYGDVSGTVSGAGYPETQYDRTELLFVSPEATSSGFAEHTGVYQMIQIDWRGSSTTTGTIHALQWRFDPTTQWPTEFLGYGTRAGVVLSSGGNVTGQDVQVAPVEAITVSGTATVPSGYTIHSRNLFVGFGPAPTAPPAWTILVDRTSASAFSYLAPNVPGAALAVHVTARTTAGSAPWATVSRTVTAGNADAISITVPPAPELVAPDDSTTGVTAGDTLEWRGTSGAVSIVTIFEEGTSDPTRLHIITAGTTAVIPDLSALGFPLSSATSYTWTVFSSGPFASLDDAAGSTSFFLPGDRSSGFSEERRFTTAP